MCLFLVSPILSNGSALHGEHGRLSVRCKVWNPPFMHGGQGLSLPVTMYWESCSMNCLTWPTDCKIQYNVKAVDKTTKLHERSGGFDSHCILKLCKTPCIKFSFEL